MMSITRFFMTVFVLSVSLCLRSPAMASAFKFGLTNTVVLFNKVSLDGTVNGMAPVGVSAWGSYFITDRLSVLGCGDINLETKNYSAVFVGGNIAANFYLAGGSIKEVNSKSLAASTVPKFNASIFAGAGGFSYNFNSFDTSSGKVVKRAKNNTLRGAVLGPVFGATSSVRLLKNFYLSGHGKLFIGLTDEVTPAITNTYFGGGVEVLF